MQKICIVDLLILTAGLTMQKPPSNGITFTMLLKAASLQIDLEKEDLPSDEELRCAKHKVALFFAPSFIFFVAVANF